MVDAWGKITLVDGGCLTTDDVDEHMQALRLMSSKNEL